MSFTTIATALVLALVTIHHVDSLSAVNAIGLSDGILLDGYNSSQLIRPNILFPVTVLNYSIPLPHRCGSAGVYTPSGIFIIGGGRGNQCNASEPIVTVFDPMSTNVANTTSMMTPRSYHAAAATIGELFGDIVVCGGLDGETESTFWDTCESFSLATLKWQVFTSLPYQTIGHQMLMLNVSDKDPMVLFSFGGYSPGLGVSKKVLAYDVHLKMWQEYSEMPFAMVYHAIGMSTVQSAILCGGKRTLSECASNICVKFTPRLQQYENAGAMETARREHKIVYFNGARYIIGGIGIDEVGDCVPLLTTEYYEIQNGGRVEQKLQLKYAYNGSFVAIPFGK